MTDWILVYSEEDEEVASAFETGYLNQAPLYGIEVLASQKVLVAKHKGSGVPLIHAFVNAIQDAAVVGKVISFLVFLISNIYLMCF